MRALYKVMKTALSLISIIFIAALLPLKALSLSPDTYAPSSVLAQGRWVKISVSQTGMHLIPVADLRSWGFSDPSKVRVYGYGGNRIPDRFSAANYVDDLPLVQSEATSRGVVFYAVGPDTRIDFGPRGLHYHSLNPYSTVGYYFLTDNDIPLREIPLSGGAPESEPQKTFVQALRHEVDEVSPMESGHRLLGEDFRYTPSRMFTFQLPGIADPEVWMQCDFYADVKSATLNLSFTANGETLQPFATDRVKASPADENGDSVRIRKVFEISGETLALGITAKSAGQVRLANLDNISLCYTRHLALPSTRTLVFTLPIGDAELAGATADTRVWDVTNPLDITRLNTTATSSGVAWSSDYYSKRTYAAWDPSASMPTPRLAARSVKNQDIHSRPTPDMVIITHADLSDQAERIAQMHRTERDSLDVFVTLPDPVYNEFASGAPDYNAFRRMMKMFYDRALADPMQRMPRYVLLMGGANFDHRRLTPSSSRLRSAVLPIWQTDEARGDSYSFSSDDPIAFLQDNSGLFNGRDMMCVAVGRIPAKTSDEARIFTDRLISYVTTPIEGEWRNRVLLLADDGDNAIHLEQTEEVDSAMRDSESGRGLIYRKVYLDAYEKQGGVTTAGRTKMHNLLNDGVVWWNFIGHASTTALTGEGVLTSSDLGNLYLRKPPFFYGATCSYIHWDGSGVSGLQTLTLAESGGVVGGIAATRPVQIAQNGPLSRAMASEVFQRDEQGRFRPVAEALRRAKNSRTGENNKLRYVMVGDPAMRLAIPENTVTLDSINGQKVEDIDDEDTAPVTIQALSKITLSGTVTSALGEKLTDFNGYVALSLYDADQTYTAIRSDRDPIPVIDEMGERLITARAKVTGGEWRGEFVLPAEIADNYRPATLSLYARTDAGTDEASGVNRQFYIYGVADNFTDNTPPEIEYLYLNHETFKPGDKVNATPMLIARVSDDTALNMATNGVGHQMTLRLDGLTSYSDISTFFTPDADGTPGGNIAYQLPELQPGVHEATLRVWDVAGNSAKKSFEFFVDPSQQPTLFDVYSDANPAGIEANFYIKHNRPDAMLTVKVDIYSISGAHVWSAESRGRADMFVTSPVHWDLTDRSGRKVGRGIYLYVTTVTTDATGDYPATSSSATRRIAVAPM